MARAISIRAARGFTLIELIIGMTVMGILALVGTSLITDTVKTTRIVNSASTSADQTRYAIERITRELREVKYTIGTGYVIAGPIGLAKTTVTFTRIINGANVVVTIARVGSVAPYTVTLGYSSPAVISTLASNVASFNLDFLKLDNTAASSDVSNTVSADLHLVAVTLGIADATSGQTISQQTRVALRNTQ